MKLRDCDHCLDASTYACDVCKDYGVEHRSPFAGAPNHDAHYQTEVQPIEVMQANLTKEELVGFLKGNIIKYVCRCGRKDETLREAEKIKRYAEWLIVVLKGERIDPRN